MTIPALLKGIRKRGRMTQARLAKNLGVRPATMSAYELGEFLPSRSVLLVLRSLVTTKEEQETIGRAMQGLVSTLEDYAIGGEITDDAINEQLTRSDLMFESGDTRGGTYEEGVANALRWLLGERDEAPMPDAVDGEEDF